MEALYEQFHTAGIIGANLFIYPIRECPVRTKGEFAHYKPCKADIFGFQDVQCLCDIYFLIYKSIKNRSPIKQQPKKEFFPIKNLF